MPFCSTFESAGMGERRGATIVELFVVLTIILIMLAFLLPAVQSARERAREMVCKNNLHQINLAIAQFAETHKQLPGPTAPGLTGGWIVEILPFIEQKNLMANIQIGEPILTRRNHSFDPLSFSVAPTGLF